MAKIMILEHLIDDLLQMILQILDDTFASQMQQLLGNALQEKDLEPPRCIMEVRSILCKDGPDYKDNTFYYWWAVRDNLVKTEETVGHNQKAACGSLR